MVMNGDSQKSQSQTRVYQFVHIHTEVVDALKTWIRRNNVDISVPVLIRYLITYAHLHEMDENYMLEAQQAVSLLDETSLIATDGVDDGRLKFRLQTNNKVIAAMSEEERYQALIAGMIYSRIMIEELALDVVLGSDEDRRRLSNDLS